MNILANLRSAFNKNQQRNVIALTAAAGIVAGVVGTATAVAPTGSVPVNYVGGISIIRDNVIDVMPPFLVPAGKKFMLTDIIVGTLAPTPGSFKIYTTATSSCSGANTELTSFVSVPASNTLVIPLVSGISVAGGKFLCLQNLETEHLQVVLRGYIFT